MIFKFTLDAVVGKEIRAESKLEALEQWSYFREKLAIKLLHVTLADTAPEIERIE